MNGQPEVRASRGDNGSTPPGVRLTPIRCLLVDDHPAVRVGLRASCWPPKQLGADLCDRVREAARGVTRLPIVPPSSADSLRQRLDPGEQAIYGLLLAGIATQEIGDTFDLAQDELGARLEIMLRKLERLDPAD
jgi:hypothetical protein